jgi:uncharacterized protein with PIN domain
MPDERCPKCNTMMIEVMKQLIVPAKLVDSGSVTAAVQVQMECPDCHFAGEPYVGGEGPKADF